MNTTQLDSILSVLVKSNSAFTTNRTRRRSVSTATNTLYLGVFSADNIPLDHLSNQAKTVYFVLNSDPSSSPGTHWLACVKAPGSLLEFFDSYGNPPSYYHLSFPANLKILSNRDSLQSIYSSVCGQYCIYFLYFRIVRKISLQKISSHLRTSFKTRKLRDQYISNFVNILSRKKSAQGKGNLYALISAAHSPVTFQNSPSPLIQSSHALQSLPHNFLDFSNSQSE